MRYLFVFDFVSFFFFFFPLAAKLIGHKWGVSSLNTADFSMSTPLKP